MAGGYALSGRGLPWARIVARIVNLASLAGTFLAPKPYPELSYTIPQGEWFDTLAVALGVGPCSRLLHPDAPRRHYWRLTWRLAASRPKRRGASFRSHGLTWPERQIVTWPTGHGWLEADLDHYQNRLCKAWYRYVTLAMLALAWFAITRAALAGENGDLLTSATEIRRMFTALRGPPRDERHARHWSRWRHRHQQRARTCHYQRQRRQDH
jgi:hypothetical protein